MNTKTYVIVTGVIFGLITLAHIARMIVEAGVAADPAYWLLTILSAALSLWACRLVLTPAGEHP